MRLHWIDWLRVAAIASVFAFHTLRPFNTADWHVKNGETTALLNGFMTFFESFGLAVLFLLAGAGVRFALRRRTWTTFLRERTTRLLVPFVVGTLLLSPLQGFIQAANKGTLSGSFADYLPVWAAGVGEALGRGPSPTVFGIGYHLWFLGFLFAISVIALPLCEWLTGDRGRRWIGVAARGFAAWPGASLALVVPIYVLMGIGSSLGTSEHDWFEFAWYFAYFMIGFLLVSDERFMAAVRRDLWPSAAVAVGSTVLIVAGIPAPADTIGDQGTVTLLVMALVFAAEGWAWTLVILNIGLRAARLQRPVSERLGDAVLPVYVIHQPVILAVAFFVVQWPLAILPKWLVVFGVSVPLTLLLVELSLRTPLTRRVLGARVRPPATGVSPRRAVVLGSHPAVPGPSGPSHAQPR